jgi:NAD+ synthase (glutamine-hydrolysing)
MKHVRIAMVQMNATVGDIHGNTMKILAGIQQATSVQADIVTFPELAITGYPPQDLLLKPQFLKENRAALDRICEATSGITAIVGFVDQQNDIYNSAAIMHNQQLLGIQHKVYLPNYGVFDENRYFQAGVPQHIFQIGDISFGVNICEDIWYPEGPTVIQALSGADLILNCSASPYYMGKPAHRDRLTAVRAADSVVVVAYNNLIGGQDRLIFDGGSLIVDQTGTILARGKLFEEDFIVADIDLADVERSKLSDPRHRKAVFELQLSDHPMQERVIAEPLSAQSVPKSAVSTYMPAISTDPAQEIYTALTLGLRDYVRKNGFSKAVLGLSGGIDSSLVAALAVDALGPENVLGILLPGPYSSQGSIDDAKQLAENFKMPNRIVQIGPIFDAFMVQLDEAFEGREPDVAEENIQARIRGVVWMAMSNKFGYLPLTTGNKSEMSVGYATMYGDMAGGLAVIADVPKTTVYQLAEYRNKVAGYDLIPRNTIEKAPSAELRADQKDSDSLPEYHILDAILKAYIEHDKSVEDIIASGFDPEVVKDVIRKVDHSEYKRQQAAPALKVTTKALGPDRRLPITNKYYG